MLDFLILSAYNRKGDAARILGVSVQTLRKLKPVRIGKERRYREVQIEFLRRAVSGSFSQVYEVRDIASGLKGNRR